MYEEHQIFELPANTNPKIWRYIDFTKFVDFLNSKALYFTRADFFEDDFEGSLTKSTVQNRTKRFDKLMKEGKLLPTYTHDYWQSQGVIEKKNMAINCWHMNGYESAAMWKLFLKSNEGIAIQSTFSNLKKCFSQSDIGINIGAVKYVDYEKDLISYGDVFSAFLHKRKSFEHERELRCVIWKNYAVNRGKVNLDSGGIKVKVIMSDLIENIYVSPDSPKWFTNLVNDVLIKYGYTFSVMNSRLNDNPIY